MSVPRWLLALALGTSAPACSQKVAGGSVDGRALFDTACATCHGERGTPPPSMVAQLGVRDLRAAEFRRRATVATVENQIRRGSANKLMPAFAGALAEEQITALARYVIEQLGKE